MKLSIIIPVYNEEKTITVILKRLGDIQFSGIEKEIIVVNDGSTDKTAERLKSYKRISIKILNHEKNKGKGVAVRTGIANAIGDYILIQDADLEYSPADIPKLIKPISDGEANIVYGTRLNRLPNLAKDEKKPRFLLHYFGNRILSLLTSILYGQWITDMETGYKLFPKNALVGINLHAKSFEFEPEITAKLLKKGFHITEVPIETNPRGYEEGKKLHTIPDGFLALWTLLKYRLVD